MKKLYQREVYKTREEWLTKGRVLGGSSAAAILGKSPWTSPLDLWNSFHYPTSDRADNEVLAYGREAEPLLRKWYRLAHPQFKVRDPKGYEMYRRTDKPYMTATVDGLVTEVGTRRKGILEIKTHEIRNREDAEKWNGRWPEHYVIQVLHYLLVLNDCEFVELCGALNFYSYDGEKRTLQRTEIRYEHIEREDVLQQLRALEAQEDAFMDSVAKGIPPGGRIEF